VEAPSVENFVRTWQITGRTYQNQAPPGQTADLVADGWVIILSVSDNGFFRSVYTPPGGSEQFFDGTWSVSGKTLTLTPIGAGYSWQFTGRVQESSMSLKGAHAEYDFSGDGAPEAALRDMAGRH
jgi:hypothetical protein